MYRSPIGQLNESVHNAHRTYRTFVSDLLGVEEVELDRLIETALAVISGCGAIGWQLGSIIGGPQMAATGAAVGAVVGIVIVAGTVAYRLWIGGIKGQPAVIATLE